MEIGVTMKRIHLYILEDNDADFDLIQYNLNKSEGWDFEITRGKTMANAMRYINENHITLDIVLMDLNLPDSDYCASIAAIPKIVIKVPVIVLTSLDMSKGYEAIRNGAQDFINKDRSEDGYIAYKIQFAIERASYLKLLKVTAFIDQETGDYTMNYLKYLLEGNSKIREGSDNLKLVLLDLRLSVATHDMDALLRAIKPSIRLLASRIGLSYATNAMRQYMFLMDSDAHQYTYLLVELERIFKDYIRENQLDLLRYGVGSVDVDKTDFDVLCKIAEKDSILLCVNK